MSDYNIDEAIKDLRRHAFLFNKWAEELENAETDREVNTIRLRLQSYQQGDEEASPKAQWAMKMLQEYLGDK